MYRPENPLIVQGVRQRVRYYGLRSSFGPEGGEAMGKEMLISFLLDRLFPLGGSSLGLGRMSTAWCTGSRAARYGSSTW